MRGSPPQEACFVRGTSPPKEVLSVRGTSPLKTDPWDQRGGSAQLVGPQEVDTVSCNRVGVCQPHGVEACQAAEVVLRSRLWQVGQKQGRRHCAVFLVLECAIERGDERKLPLNSFNEGPTLSMLSCALLPEVLLRSRL